MDPMLCPICGDELSDGDGEAVACAACEAPHHERCWRWTGGCSSFGCGCAYVRPAPSAHGAATGGLHVAPEGQPLDDRPWPIPTERDPEGRRLLLLGQLSSLLVFLLLHFKGAASFSSPWIVLWAILALPLPLSLILSAHRCRVDRKGRRLLLYWPNVGAEVDRRILPFEEIAFVSVTRDTRNLPPSMVPGSTFCHYSAVAALGTGELVELSAGHASPAAAGAVGENVAALLDRPFVRGKEGQDLIPGVEGEGLVARFGEVPSWVSLPVTIFHVLAHLALAIFTLVAFFVASVLPWTILALQAARALGRS